MLHSAARALAILSLVTHIYMAVFVTRGVLGAMTEGRVTEGWARHHDAAWADEMLGQCPVVHGTSEAAPKLERPNGASA